MLKTSTKNVAQEVVSILINHCRDYNYGILPDLETNFLKKVNKQSLANNLKNDPRNVSKARLPNESADIEGCPEDEEEEKIEEEVRLKKVLATS